MTPLIVMTVVVVIVVLWIRRDAAKNKTDSPKVEPEGETGRQFTIGVESLVPLRKSTWSADAVSAYATNYLLSRFHGGANLFQFHDHPIYADRLGRSPELVLQEFLRDDLLRPLNPGEAVDQNLKVTELKEILKSHGMPVSGRKADLVERVLPLVGSDETLIAASKSPNYTVTAKGLNRLATFYADESNRYRTTVAAIEEALEHGDIGVALELSETYNDLLMWGYGRIKNDEIGRSALAGILSSVLGSQAERNAAAFMALMPAGPPAVRAVQ